MQTPHPTPPDHPGRPGRPNSPDRPGQRDSPRLLPWRFMLFLALFLTSVPLAIVLPLPVAVMAGFDSGAVVFFLSLAPLLHHRQARMRAHARANDANRMGMLLITSIVMLVLMVVVAAELAQRSEPPSPAIMVLILGTLAIAWTFSNMVYALHYAFLYYSADTQGRDLGGIRFPATGEAEDAPDYWDFLYFAFTLGMTFQTSDVEIMSRSVRKTVTFHCLAAFVFNLGIIAFTINVLGSR